MNATKSMIGHCLGAAGGMEAIATIQAIRTGWVHPTINHVGAGWGAPRLLFRLAWCADLSFAGFCLLGEGARICLGLPVAGGTLGRARSGPPSRQAACRPLYVLRVPSRPKSHILR